jgi:hypothetical protein
VNTPTEVGRLTPAARVLADVADGVEVLALLRAMPGLDGGVLRAADRGGVQRRRVERWARATAQRAVRRVRDRPPVVSRGWQSGPPDFVGIGVQRAGTSWWFALLEAHPDVHRLGSSAAKELHHFDDFELRPHTPADVAAYHRNFLRPPGTQCGEWTPRYLYDPWVPPLLVQAAPDAKLLVLLRDPVERFRSGITHALERTGRVTVDDVTDAFARGLYHAQLERLWRSVTPEQVLVLTFEACRADPATQLVRTEEFLGLDGAVPPTLDRPRNEAGGAKLELDAGWLADIRAAYGPDRAQLAARCPDLDLSGWASSMSS